MAKIVIIDDDAAMEILANALRYRGHEVSRETYISGALNNIQSIIDADVVVLDILMPYAHEGACTTGSLLPDGGMGLLTEIRKRRRNLPVMVRSAIQDKSIVEALEEDPATKFVSKWESHPLREVVSLVHKMLGVSSDTTELRPFIVHGHADQLKLELKNYIQNTLNLPEPVILHEQPSLGRSIIEKFEDYAAATALVFVLITPDDIAASVAEPDDTKRRARQNVVFEMGYFLGLLGRESGRVLLLHKGALELPSDLSGIVYIDISNGIEAAGEMIRKEINHVNP